VGAYRAELRGRLCSDHGDIAARVCGCEQGTVRAPHQGSPVPTLIDWIRSAAKGPLQTIRDAKKEAIAL
jgi:hypothetical protein